MDIVTALADPPPARGRRHLGRGIVSVVTVILAVFGLPESALAETGRQRFHITYAGPLDPTSFPERPVTASGPIHGEGYDLFITQAPGPEPGSFQSASQLVFPEGSLFVAYTGTFEFRFNPDACQASTRVTGTWTVTSGTGQYTGTTGEGILEGHNIQSGEKAPGGCPAQPDRLVSNLRLMGTLTVPDQPG